MFTSLRTNKLLVKPTAKQELCFVFKSSKDSILPYYIGNTRACRYLVVVQSYQEPSGMSLAQIR